jgi:hypothetical protein
LWWLKERKSYVGVWGFQKVTRRLNLGLQERGWRGVKKEKKDF